MKWFKRKADDMRETPAWPMKYAKLVEENQKLQKRVTNLKQRVLTLEKRVGNQQLKDLHKEYQDASTLLDDGYKTEVDLDWDRKLDEQDKD